MNGAQPRLGQEDAGLASDLLCEQESRRPGGRIRLDASRHHVGRLFAQEGRDAVDVLEVERDVEVAAQTAPRAAGLPGLHRLGRLVATPGSPHGGSAAQLQEDAQAVTWQQGAWPPQSASVAPYVAFAQLNRFPKPVQLASLSAGY